MPCRPEHLPDEKVEELIQKLPRKLLETLLLFHLDGLKFGLRRGGRCLIAEEMGLGKTLQAIAIASCFANEGSILVVCPTILRYNWAEELECWLPSYLPADIHLGIGSSSFTIRGKDANGENVIKPYTLTTLDSDVCYFELVIKMYPQGRISHHFREMREGDHLSVKGPKGRFKYQPGQVRAFGMLAGGIGITPMFQVARAILENPTDKSIRLHGWVKEEFLSTAMGES